MGKNLLFDSKPGTPILKKSLRALQVILLAASGYAPATSAQDSSLDLEQFQDTIDTSSVWLSYGPKDSEAYSFWYSKQNGVEANWTLPEGYSLGETRFPQIIERGDRQAPTFVLSGESRIYQQLLISPGSDIAAKTITLSLTYGDCAAVCTTKTGQARIELTASPTPLDENESIPMRNRGILVRADGENISVGMHKAYNEDGQVDRAFFLPLDPAVFDAPAPLRLDPFKETGFFASFPLKTPLAGDAPVAGILVLDKPYEGGLNSFFVSPENDYAVAGDMPKEPVADAGTAAGSQTSYLTAILLALVGGLVLNIMPCVFPVLALKVFSVLKSGASNEGEMRKDALAYSAGVIVNFALLAAILLIVRGAGAGVGWGFQLQTPAFVLSMAILFFVMGLNFLGFFEIPSFMSNAGHGLTQKKGVTGSFFTGALATLVAAPCTAPFMVTAVAFALAQPPLKAISIFMALGLGLALPYLIIGFVPASRRFFPKPGQWIGTFRSFLAFPMFATMAWMIWILSIQSGPTGVLFALSVMVVISYIVWLSTSAAGLKKGVITLVGLVAIIYSVASVKPLEVRSSYRMSSEMASSDYAAIGNMQVVPFSHEKLAALRNDGKNVFVHHWAAWCIVCLMHENLVFSQDDFQNFLRDSNIVFMQADRTNDDPELLRFMEKTYGRSSQPIDVFYTSVMDSKPIVFPTMFTPEKVIHLMKNRLQEVPR